MRQNLPMLIIFAVQAICAVFFTGNIILSVLGFPPVPWAFLEATEIAAAGGLILGVVMGIIAIGRSEKRKAKAEARLRVAAGAFREVMEERFEEWQLTKAERDVALFAIKGLSTTDIAALRSTSEGTVKAQTAAIYRKAGVSGRPQLLSLFIDDLMSGSVAAEIEKTSVAERAKVEASVI